MQIRFVTGGDREREHPHASAVIAFLVRTGKWINGPDWVLLQSAVTRLWSLDLLGEPVLTDVRLAEIAESL